MSGVNPFKWGAVVLSPNWMGLVATGVWSEEVWLRSTLFCGVCLFMCTFPALPVVFQLPEIFFMESLVVPAIKPWVRGVERESGCGCGKW